MAETQAQPQSQSGQASDDPPELKRLRIEKAISDQQTAIAQNRLKLIKDMLPSGTKALEGKAEVKGDPIECQILAYRALDRLADAIAQTLGGGGAPTRLIVYDESSINALLALRAFNTQVDVIEKQLQAEITDTRAAVKAAEQAAAQTEPPAALVEAAPAGVALGAAPMVVSGVLRSAAELLSLFRVDVSLTYKNLTISDLTLVAAVASHLNIPLYDPARVPLNLSDEASDLRNRLGALALLRGDIDIGQANVTRLQNQLNQQIRTLDSRIEKDDAAKLDTAPLRNLRSTKTSAADRLTAVAARLQAVGASFDAFQSALLKADETSGTNALVRLIRAEKLKAVADTAGTHWLHLKVVAAGGGYKTKHWLWWPTTKVLYSGGAIAEFMLFDGPGKIVRAGIVPKYTGFLNLGEQPDTTLDLGAGL